MQTISKVNGQKGGCFHYYATCEYNIEKVVGGILVSFFISILSCS